MTDFSDLEHKLKTTYAPSPWRAWAEARQAARMEAFEAMRKPDIDETQLSGDGARVARADEAGVRDE